MIGEIVAGVAQGLAGSAIGQHFTDMNREADFKNWDLARQKNFNDSQRVQINAPINTKLGMMYAGLDPTQSAPSPVTPASSPMQSSKMQPLELAQYSNLMADAKQKEAEAEKTNVETANLEGENEGANSTYKEIGGSLVQTLRDNGLTGAADSLENDIDGLIKSGKPITSGHLKGVIDAYKTFDEFQQRITNSLSKIVDTKEALYKLDNDTAKDLARMPKLQADLTAKYISTQMAMAEYLSSGADLNKEKVNEVQQHIKNLRQEVQLMVSQGKLTEAQAKQITNTDWKSLMYDGEFAKAAVALGEKEGEFLIQEGVKVAQSVIHGRAMLKSAQIHSDAVKSIARGTPQTISGSVPPAPQFRSNPKESARQSKMKSFDDIYDKWETKHSKKDIVKHYSKLKQIIDSPEFTNPDW